MVLVINPAKQRRQVPLRSRQGKLTECFQFQVDSSVCGCFPLCIILIQSSMEFFAAALAAPYPQILFGDVTFTCNFCLLKSTHVSSCLAFVCTACTKSVAQVKNAMSTCWSDIEKTSNGWWYISAGPGSPFTKLGLMCTLPYHIVHPKVVISCYVKLHAGGSWRKKKWWCLKNKSFQVHSF